MKKFLLSCALLVTALMAQAAVGDDITSKYLQNADFSQGTPVVGYICTYDYDMEKNATNMYGQQPVEGWTNVTPSDNTFIEGRTDGVNARAAGIFTIGAYDEVTGEPQAFLGGTGYFAPDQNSFEQTEGNALGMVAVWGAPVQYTQAVTLPAGAYTMKFTIWNNAGTSTVNQNLFGFIADNGTAYTVDQKSWIDEWTWCVDEVTFVLTEETSGVISVGYASANAGSGAMPHLFVDYVQIIEADPAEIDRQEAEKLKPELLELLEAGEKMGVSTKAGWAVYNNENATLAQVQEAIANQKEINAANMTDFTDFFINNAHFTLGDPLDNGICTYAKDMGANATTYFGMQPVTDWIPNDPGTDGKAAGLFPVGGGVKNVSGNDSTWLGTRNAGFVPPSTKANGETEGNIFGFVSCWTFKAYYSQAVTLPAGSYTITIPTYNATGGTQAIAKNYCGFIADDGSEYLAETKVFPVNQWSNETIKFELEEETSGIITIGYEAANTGSGNQPHLFIDEFTLMFNGKTDVDPSLIALNGAIRSGESLLASGEVFEAAIGEQLEEVLDEARALKDAGSDDAAANTAAATKVNNAVQALKNSIAAYAKFYDFLQGKYYETIEKYEGTEMEEFANELADSLLEYDDAYSFGTYTTDDINAIINGLDAKERAAIQAVLEVVGTDGEEHNLDISLLFENVNFANKSTAGWTSSVTSGKFESQQNGVCEVWSAEPVSFNAYTTLKNLPAGIYEISAPAWYRAAGDAAPGYDAYVSETETGTSYIYANGNKTKVLSQYVDQLFADAEDNMHNAAVGPGYTPNGQAQAQAIFYTSDIDVNNTVVTGLTEPGDLTIGFKGEGFESGTWTVWGEMTIVYKGQNNEVLALCLNDEITALVEEAAAKTEDENVYPVEASLDQLCKAIEQGEGAVEASEVEEKVAAVAALKDAIAYANETASLLNQLANTSVAFETLLGNSELDSEDTTLENLLSEANPENGVKDNDQIKEWINAFPGAWTKFVCGQSAMAQASEEAPVNVTEAILNADFKGLNKETPGAEYWNKTRTGGNDNVEYDIYEFYDTQSFDINQTLVGLTPGFYRVSVQSFYRAGSNADNVATYVENHDSINTVKFYANNDSVVVKNVLELEDCENADTMYIAGSQLGVNGEVTVEFNDNPTYYVPNNRESMSAYNALGQYWNELVVEVGEDGTLKIGLNKQAGLSIDWCPFDNFTLEYLGTAEPVAIETLKTTDAAINANDAIYDLQGRKVTTPVKGLYIINHKVVLVK